MLIELGNHAALRGIDDRPKVTRIYIPEFDDGSDHPEGRRLGGYTHEPGAITVDEFRAHRAEAMDLHNGITRLPDHEALLSIVAAWPTQAYDAPAWVKVSATHDHEGSHPQKSLDDVEVFLRDFYRIPDKAAKPPVDELEARYWTRFGAPGQGQPDPSLPDVTNLFLNSGRVIANVNDGGGQTGLTGTGTAATATTFTTNLTLTTNAWAGYRIYAMQTATGPLVYGNVLSNTNAAGASVVTVDRWYSAATPGGSAPAAPSAGFYFMLADGGVTSAWFVGLTTTNITPAATDTALAGEYTVAAGGMYRKIAPYAQTSGVATRSLTLTPVFTANGSDTFPSTFYAIGVGVSAVVPYTGPMFKFETPLNASATTNVSGDQVTVTETIQGS